MAGNGIRISTPVEDRPRQACMPMTRSKRWVSIHEQDGRIPNVKVFMTQSAYARILMHSTSELNDEVGGALVGLWCADRDSGEQFVVVQHMLPARHTRQGSVYLTFTQDTILDFHDEIENKYSGKKIVGWYHTHPRMGVFLSHFDTFLHNNFFPEPWQVALVVEPHSSVAGFFVRVGSGYLDPSRYYGFYELNGSPDRSVVNWRNLQSDEEENEGV